MEKGVMEMRNGEKGMTSEKIVVVSGLPRSGTSLMMQMLDHGGVELVTDGIRAADTDNPKGYYELEQVKRIQRDASWIPQTRGKALKMVSQLLYDLPSSERYQIIFMEREFDEMLASQEKMLERLGRPTVARDEMARSFTLHLERLHEWLGRQPHIELLRVSYNVLLEEPRLQAERVCAFLGFEADVDAMALTVDPSLYRNRK
jgi:hypothetical protein